MLNDNFHYPYAAIGFSDFWRRWHMSLSSWLRDYLYISLGGSRKGNLRTYVNLTITMLLGGLWHGASWRFVAWGGVHGLFLMIERFLKTHLGGRVPITSRLVQIALALLTFLVVSMTWVFFPGDQLLRGVSGSRADVPAPRVVSVLCHMPISRPRW